MDYAIKKVTIDDYDAIFELWNATEQSRRAIIHHLCVHPDYRRMGIAGHLNYRNKSLNDQIPAGE